MRQDFETATPPFYGQSEIARPTPAPVPGSIRALRAYLARKSRSQHELGEYEFETPSKKNSNLLSFKIPEAPYSDESMKWLHKGFDIVTGVDAVLTMFETEVITLIGTSAAAGLGVALGVAAPFAGFLANMLALGSGYAEARAKIAKDRVRIGFAKGFVLGADWRSWKYAKSMFWEARPEPNSWDQDAGKIAQKAFNLGLVSGFIQGRKLSQQQRDFFWHSLTQTLTTGDRVYFADSKTWAPSMWLNWYTRVAGSFLALYAKD
jgi:hypothetical protein